MKLAELLTGDATDVAPRLLGWRIRSNARGTQTEVSIIEVEAYGPDDPASHAHRGRTRSNAPMFDAAGCWYVYRSYGIHWCVNLVTGPVGSGQAVLVRSGLPLAGVDTMRARRGRDDNLVTGPGNLTQALAIDGSHNLYRVGSGPVKLLPPLLKPSGFRSGPRVGVSRAADRPLRFTAVFEPKDSPRS